MPCRRLLDGHDHGSQVKWSDRTLHSARLMRHAWQQLGKGDRLQASEKAWGAVAHRLKVVANARGWKYDTHRDVYDIKDRVAAETDDPHLGAGPVLDRERTPPKLLH